MVFRFVRPMYLLVLMLAALLIAGCGSSQEVSSGSSEADALFSAAPDPLKVTVQTDDTRTASADLTPAGGSLSAEAADGTRFTLEIPSGALVQAARLTMTPLADIPDLPTQDGFIAGVDLGPDGLELFEDAILTIEPAAEVPVENQILFGYLEDGEDLHLAIPGPDYSAIQIRVTHFSGFGLGSGIGTDRSGLLLKRAANHELRLQSQLAEALQLERQNQMTGQSSEAEQGRIFNDYLNSYYGLVVRPRLLAASESCDNTKLALTTYLNWQSLRQTLGLVQEGEGIGEAAGILDQAIKLCMQEAYQECVNDHVLGEIIPLAASFNRMQQLLGKVGDDSPYDPEIWKYVDACMRFELEFDSTIVLDTEDTFMETAVRANVPLQFSGPGTFEITGEGPLETLYHNPRIGDCTLDSSTHSGGTFNTYALNLLFDGNGQVQDILMRYYPGLTSEGSSHTCCDGEQCYTLTMPAVPLWSSWYLNIHMIELNTGEGGIPAEGSESTGPDPMGQALSSGDPSQILESMGQMDPNAFMQGLQGLNSGADGIPDLMQGIAGPGGSIPGTFSLLDWDIEGGEEYATVESSGSADQMSDETIFTLYHRPAPIE